LTHKAIATRAGGTLDDVLGTCDHYDGGSLPVPRGPTGASLAPAFTT